MEVVLFLETDYHIVPFVVEHLNFGKDFKGAEVLDDCELLNAT